MKKLLNNEFKTKQRFSIRKLTVGATSVLIGLTFLGVNGNQVHADVTSNNQSQASQVQEQTQAREENTNTTVQKPEQAPTVTEKNPTDQAIVADQNNSSKPNKVNGRDGNETITNVPSDGSITYDYSITAKNKNDGKVQAVNSGDSGKDNRATIVTNNADDIEAHLTLTNTSNTTKHVGPNDNGDVVRFFINAWTGPIGTLKIDSSKAANIVFIKDNQVENNNALPVYYLASDTRWLTYNDMVTNFGQDAISKVTQVGIRGDIPANTTAQMNVPLVVDSKAILSNNQISTNGLNAKSIYVRTFNGKVVWTTDEIKNERLYLTTRDADGSYSVVDDQGWFNDLPKAGDVVKIVNGGGLSPDDTTTLYTGGQYRINLADIQRVLQEHGYSVDPQNDNLESPMDYYSYIAASGLQIHNSDKSSFTPPEGHPFFYIEVHKIVNTKDMTFEQGSSEAQNWNAQQGITGVFNIDNPKAVSNGYQYVDDSGSIQDAQLVSIRDSNGRNISAIDGNTPAGTYTVTVAYKLNGSSQSSMAIRNTYVAIITPRHEQPVTPPENNNNNNQPGNNTSGNNQSGDSGQTNQPTNSEDTTPAIPPVQVTDVDNPATETVENNRPLPENQPAKPEKEQPKNPSVVAPKATVIKKTNKRKAMPIPKVAAVKVNKNSKKPASEVKNTVVKQKNTVSTASKAKAELPYTGEKQSAIALVGLSLAAIGLIGLAALRKRN